MTVLRLTHPRKDLPLDIELDDVVEISAETSGGGPAVVVEADNGSGDNYRYFGASIKITNRDSRTYIPLHNEP